MTLLEVMIAIAILGLAGLSVHHVLRALGQSYGAGMTRMDMDLEGARTVDRVVSALRAADDADLAAVADTPFFSSTIAFRRNLGFTGTECVWSELETVTLDPVRAEVRWSENDGQPSERVLWRGRSVAAFLEGEEDNGNDDNLNDLADEPGFFLSQEGDLFRIGLTLEAPDSTGRLVRRTWSSSIRPRN